MFYIKGNSESELLNVVDKFIPTPLQYVILSYLNVRENLNISLVNKFFNVTSIRDAYWLHYIYIDEIFNKKVDYCDTLIQNAALLQSKDILDNKCINTLKAKYISIYQTYKETKIANPSGIVNKTWIFSDLNQELDFHEDYSCNMRDFPTLFWGCQLNIHNLLFLAHETVAVVNPNAQPNQVVTLERTESNVLINEEENTRVDIRLEHKGKVPEGANDGELFRLRLVETEQIKSLRRYPEMTDKIYMNNFPVHNVVRLDDGRYVAYNEVIFFFEVSENDRLVEELSDIVKDGQFQGNNGYNKIKILELASKALINSEDPNIMVVDGHSIDRRLNAYKARFKAYKSLYRNVTTLGLGTAHPQLEQLVRGLRSRAVEMRRQVYCALEAEEELSKEPNWPADEPVE